ncbi:MAG: hypothetical protein AAFY84_09970 [Pseudomonadota bacterium]
MDRLGYLKYWAENEAWPDFCFQEQLPYDCRDYAPEKASKQEPEQDGSAAPAN